MKFTLKGTVSRDFLLLVFFMNQFPQAPEYTSWAVMNFFENSRRYSQLKVDHRYQRHRWQSCHRYQRNRRQILPPLLLVWLMPVACQRYRRQICCRCQRRWWQICRLCQRRWWQTMGVISGCRYLKVNLRSKMYICVTSTIQKCPNKIIKNFWIEDFFFGQPWSVNISANFRKNWKLWGWGEKPEAKNLVTLSL